MTAARRRFVAEEPEEASVTGREEDAQGSPGDPKLGANGGGRAGLVSIGSAGRAHRRRTGPLSLPLLRVHHPRHRFASARLRRTLLLAGAGLSRSSPSLYVRYPSGPLLYCKLALDVICTSYMNQANLDIY